MEMRMSNFIPVVYGSYHHQFKALFKLASKLFYCGQEFLFRIAPARRMVWKFRYDFFLCGRRKQKLLQYIIVSTGKANVFWSNFSFLIYATEPTETLGATGVSGLI